MKRSLFYYRPRKGDVWSYRTPGKRRKTKTVARVFRTWYTLPWTYENGHQQRRHPTAFWVRQNKGRHSQIRVKWLLKYGRLVSRGLPIDLYRHSGKAAADRAQILWAFTTNTSSQRWHAYRERKAICGVPWTPVMSEATEDQPGSHSACRKCERLVAADRKAEPKKPRNFKPAHYPRPRTSTGW